jgi:hypothetical protein
MRQTPACIAIGTHFKSHKFFEMDRHPNTFLFFLLTAMLAARAAAARFDRCAAFVSGVCEVKVQTRLVHAVHAVNTSSA